MRQRGPGLGDWRLGVEAVQGALGVWQLRGAPLWAHCGRAMGLQEVLQVLACRPTHPLAQRDPPVHLQPLIKAVLN